MSVGTRQEEKTEDPRLSAVEEEPGRFVSYL